MREFTKKAIQEAFDKLLNQKSLNQISVNDIINECGISRSTFYYNFRDIPDLIESIVKQNTDSIVKDHPQISSIAECVNAVIDSSLKNKKAVLHIYKSANRYIFEKYLWETCEYAVTTYFKTCTQEVHVSDNDRRILINYMKSICFGIVMCWLDNDLVDTMQEDIQRVCEIKQGDVQKLIQKCKIDF